MVFGDFNSDGILDLAYSVSPLAGGELIVCLGAGNGTFGNCLVSEMMGIGSPYSLAVGDFNGDGILDILGANPPSGPAILLGNGDGTFTYSTFPLVTSGGLPATVADLNGDGFLDIAFSNSTSGKLEVLLGNGDGTFTAKTGQPDFTGAFSINAADFNGDGKLDLITSDGIFLGSGDGTFGRPLRVFHQTSCPQSLTPIIRSPSSETLMATVGSISLGAESTFNLHPLRFPLAA